MNRILYLIVYIFALITYPLWWAINWLIEWWTPTYEKEGIFCVVGRTGSGKSTFKTYLELQNEYNKGCYTLTNVESSATNIVEDKIRNIWNEDETQYNFNGSGVNLATFDEIHVEFDNRDFKSESYKKVFQPFARWGTLHRHQKVKRLFFFASSWDSLDIKIKRLTHYVIDIDHTKRIDIPYMIKHKKIVRIPNHLKLTVFEKQDYEDNKEYFEMVKKGFFQTKLKIEDLDRYKIKISSELLERHNTYVYENHYKDKPVYPAEKKNYEQIQTKIIQLESQSKNQKELSKQNKEEEENTNQA